MPKKSQKKQKPRRRSIPTLIKLVAHCVHPGYRQDYVDYRQSPCDSKCAKCGMLVPLPVGHGPQGNRCPICSKPSKEARDISCPRCGDITRLEPGHSVLGRRCQKCSKPLDESWLQPDEFDRKYPHSGIRAYNPFLIKDSTWVGIARNNGKISPGTMTVLGRHIGAEENPDSISLEGGPDDPLRVLSSFLEHEGDEPLLVEEGTKPSINVIPASSRIPQENLRPKLGYRKTAIQHLSKERWLRLEVDLHAPRPTLERRFRSMVEEYQKLLNLDGRNKEEMLKFLALYRVTEIAKEKGIPPQVILHPEKFKARREMTPTARKEWVALNKIFSNARRRANEIFGIAVLPEKEK